MGRLEKHCIDCRGLKWEDVKERLKVITLSFGASYWGILRTALPMGVT